ncbi:MAG: nucleotidyltransferase [Deltaproteobacteria bacterium]|nr:nucleotidyltransferase [Deltaproteobacteria bacterium]
MRLASLLPQEPALNAATLAQFANALRALNERAVPYLVGGAYALKHYCGINRDTKDVDLFVERSELDRALSALEDAGFRTELVFSHWLAKAWVGDRFIDVIFGAGNGFGAVDRGWFEYSEPDVLLGVPVRICPAEETLCSKAFVMERERYDGADVNHLLLARGDRFDWERLIARFGEHGRVLLSHLVLFGYAFPAERAKVPGWVMFDLCARVVAEGPETAIPPVCKGTFLSRQQYLVDIDRGCADARLPPVGTMSPEDVAVWTAAIGRVP